MYGDCVFFYGVNDPDTAQYVSTAAGLVQEHELEVKPPKKPEFVPPTMASGWAQFWGSETAEQKRYRLAIEVPTKPNDPFSGMAEHQHARSEWELERSNADAQYQDAMNIYAHARSCVGHHRVSPEQVMQITRRNPERKVSDHALVLQEGACWINNLWAYFEEDE
jgi:hypothetical protein